MWIYVFFDLPVGTKDERSRATRFRKFLIDDGYMMIQFSVYARICNGQERTDKHLARLETKVPPKGHVRAMQVTDRQYARQRILVGRKAKNEEKGTAQLVLF